MEKIKVINRLVTVVTVIGFTLLGLTLLSLLGIIDMNSMLLILLSSGIFSILNGYYNIKNKKVAIFCILVGFFLFFVAVLKIFF
ncbi:hypothetical protein G9F71_026040 [Clostridium sp. FP2]|uniref:hypothetical protein n=1 Tax=Clostridium TaxID=1485 RepID=UPI0013E99064|nr:MULTISPECIES: hypothetical protein [Clostridium]MBW9159385.1 hypothetical protein [Clostridium tagluense]MBZ9626270.1 hypothetical protein [Clostridium sp. FP2]WLC68103.1 hypothetical protein KTC93_24315 [Clostridium tagluense]